MAQAATPIKMNRLGNKRKSGVHSKTKTSSNKKSSNYKKPYNSQGR